MLTIMKYNYNNYCFINRYQNGQVRLGALSKRKIPLLLLMVWSDWINRMPRLKFYFIHVVFTTMQNWHSKVRILRKIRDNKKWKTN